MEKKPTSSTTAGLIISLILIVLSLAIYFLGLYSETWIQYIGFVVLCAGIIWAVVNNGKERNHQVTFGSLFGFGFKVTAVIICIVIVYTVLSGFIFPDIKVKVIEAARTNALSQAGAADTTQIEKGMEMFEKNYTLFLVLGIIFWYLVLGAIASLIGAAVTKKKPQTPFQ